MARDQRGRKRETHQKQKAGGGGMQGYRTPAARQKTKKACGGVDVRVSQGLEHLLFVKRRRVTAAASKVRSSQGLKHLLLVKS